MATVVHSPAKVRHNYRMVYLGVKLRAYSHPVEAAGVAYRWAASPAQAKFFLHTFFQKKHGQAVIIDFDEVTIEK